jgi:hypothetical protein
VILAVAGILALRGRCLLRGVVLAVLAVRRLAVALVRHLPWNYPEAGELVELP